MANFRFEVGYLMGFLSNLALQICHSSRQFSVLDTDLGQLLLFLVGQIVNVQLSLLDLFNLILLFNDLHHEVIILVFQAFLLGEHPVQLFGQDREFLGHGYLLI